MRRVDRGDERDITRTIAIVGGGFSGTALALRILGTAGRSNVCVVLIERSGRFGAGLAYGGMSDSALLNVPAGQMSIDERHPHDFVTFLLAQGYAADRSDFVPRRLYGQYLEARLDEAATASEPDTRLVRIIGTATSLSRRDAERVWQIEIDDGRTIRADQVVLATGHSPPCDIDALRSLANTRFYVAEPWSMLPSARPDARVLVVGTGLSMADAVCDITARPDGPRQIIAVSRRGLLSRTRHDFAPRLHEAPPWHLPTLEPSDGLRQLVATVRAAIRNAETLGVTWHEVVAALSPLSSRLWTALSNDDRKRFARHVRPFWDAHRHQLPPQIARQIHALIAAGRLKIVAGHIVSARILHGSVVVRLRSRGNALDESIDVDQVINCSGPEGDPRFSRSTLIQSLLADGTLTPHPGGLGVLVDRCGQLENRAGDLVAGLYYLGQWLRARDWEATAVCELRREASELAHVLQRNFAQDHSKQRRSAPDLRTN